MSWSGEASEMGGMGGVGGRDDAVETGCVGDGAGTDAAALRRFLLDEVQSGFPLSSKPYDVLAARLGVRAEETWAAVESLRDDGVIRRIGASFASAKLGFTSVLCALAVEGGEGGVDRVARIVNAHVEVTHNYLRDDRYNLWFTVIARNERARNLVLETIVSESRCDDLLVLPAMALYKVRVDFSGVSRMGERPAGEDGHPAGAMGHPVRVGERPDGAREHPAAAGGQPEEAAGRPFDASDPFDVALVRWAQGDASGADPFAAAAAQVSAELEKAGTDATGIDEMSVINRLRSWKADGTIRRFGAMVRHRRMGYLRNGMCVFDAPEERLDEMGHALAELPFVSHCYARPRFERWPYNLYAMAHAKTEGELRGHVEDMRSLVGLAPKVLVSTKEYKKTSPVYFAGP